MFWRFGGYAQVSTIDTLLDKPDVTLEELLNEGDLVQELKSHNTKLIEYLREDPILEKLLEYVVATKLEPVATEDYDTEEKTEEGNGKTADEDHPFRAACTSESGDEDDKDEKARNRYAYVAAEILSSDSWSLTAALLENEDLLRKFWQFLDRPTPLDPLQAGYFTKVNEALFEKKTEEMLELFKSIPNVAKSMLLHVDSPMVMDLLLKIISLEKAEGGQGIADWLHSQDLIPILLSFLSPEHPWSTQTSAGDFLKAIITISANASQNEQSCIGPNSLTRQLVSEECIQKLINDMLKGGNPLTVGVGIVIEVIRKNNSDYDPEVGADSIKTPSSRDPIYLGSLLHLFAKHIPDFVALMLNRNHTIDSKDGPMTVVRKELDAAFGGRIEPLGFDRFKTCELMAELLHCSNMGLLNEPGAEAFVRARDTVREKLRAEGKLIVSPRADNDGMAIRTPESSRLGSNSPEEMRRLEIQNGSDDDGFEEVSHAQELEDDIKDEFDEKPDSEYLLDNLKSGNFSSFIDKNDNDFVDEPLTSPCLQTEDNHADSPFVVKPLSPTKQLLDKMGDMKIDDSKNADKPPSYGEHSKDTAVTTDASPVATKEATEEEDLAANLSALTIHSASASAKPHDEPAPLFSGKKNATTEQSTTRSASQEQAAQVPPPMETAHTDTQPTVNTKEVNGDDTITEHPESAQNTALHVPLGVTQDQDTPVVGDYLKIQFVEHNVVPTILDFFFRFPWNNFLHNVVYDVVQQVFNGSMERGYNRELAIDVFKTGNITRRIVDGQKRSDDAEASSKMRLGYMGHLTLIAEEVVKFTERHAPEVLSDIVVDKVMDRSWVNYVEITLAATRERDNAILGGVRPDQSIGGRAGNNNAVTGTGSTALADAGLNGNASLDALDFSNGNGALNAGFGISGNSLLSGFGDSSDEEDEDLDEDLNEDNAGGGGVEFSKYISNPSTTTATTTSIATPDLDPPAFAAPLPPPPPLNIPPSRARRLLADRLALHNQKTQEASVTDGEPELSASPERSNDLNRDPFADMDSDDDLEIEGGPSDDWSLPAFDNRGRQKETSGFDDNFDEHVGAPSNDASFSSSPPSDAPLQFDSFVNLDPPHLSASLFVGEGTISDGGDARRDEDHGGSSKVGTSAADLSTKPRSISPFKSGFSSLWPFGHASRGHRKRSVDQRYGIVDREDERTETNTDVFDQTDSDSDDGFDGVGEREAAGDFEGRKGRNTARRPSITTEAKSRTSLDDDEDIEVVMKRSGVDAPKREDEKTPEGKQETAAPEEDKKI